MPTLEARRRFAPALLVALLMTLLQPSTGGRAAADNLMTLLKQPGHIAFMRHAWAPFDGAPRESTVTAETLGPCNTQRNLDEKGRADARRIGELFRREGVTFDHIYTSKWCRCRETAELIAGGPVENLPLINSFFTAPDKAERGPRQIAALKRHLNEALPPSSRSLMVTHGSLISALTGIDTGEAEIVVVKADGRGGVVIVGRGVP